MTNASPPASTAAPPLRLGPLALPDMETAADRLMPLLPPGALLLLSGELGAGKTHLARLILRRLGHAGRAASPSFILCNQYDTPAGRVSHLDFYRIRDFRELLDIGLEEILAESRLAMIEWPDRFLADLERLGRPAVRVRIEVRPDDTREMLVE